MIRGGGEGGKDDDDDGDNNHEERADGARGGVGRGGGVNEPS